jgi:hypothetical protein
MVQVIFRGAHGGMHAHGISQWLAGWRGNDRHLASANAAIFDLNCAGVNRNPLT